MPAPTSYDASSPNEQAPPLPSAPAVDIGPSAVLQPPLSRRGTGPGLIIVLPGSYATKSSSGGGHKSLDPEPMQKWAEEGFAVVAVTGPKQHDGANSGFDLVKSVLGGVDALKKHSDVDVKDKLGLIVYDEELLDTILQASDELQKHNIAGIVTYSRTVPSSAGSIPLYAHTSASAEASADPPLIATMDYPDTKALFVIPSAASYDPPSATLAHTRSLVFLRKHLGGPTFDLDKIWDEHTNCEFEKRSVAQTMATMVAEPYVNHIPTMIGGMGRENLTAFYRDHFMFCNPPDVTIKSISRTVGPDRVVDEIIFSCTHTTHIPYLLPNIAPTNARLNIPMVAVVNIRGDRLYHEHIWWDQATVLRQVGILPTHLPFDGAPGGKVKLPVAGAECARLLVDGRDGKSNEMLNDK